MFKPLLNKVQGASTAVSQAMDEAHDQVSDATARVAQMFALMDRITTHDLAHDTAAEDAVDAACQNLIDEAATLRDAVKQLQAVIDSHINTNPSVNLSSTLIMS